MRLIKKNLIWAILFVGVTLIAVYFTCSATFELIRFFSLTKEAPAKITAWEILPLRRGKYAVAGRYKLNWEGKNVEGVTQFSPPHYLNYLSAEETIRQMAKNNWKVWISSNGIISSLEKKFPWNRFFRSLVSIGILLYLIRIKLIISN